MEWKDVSISKLQRCNRWRLEMDKKFHPTLYRACDYLSMWALKLNHVSERGPWTDSLINLLRILRWPLDPWRRHQMETFSALLALCAGNSPVTGEYPTQRPVTRCFDVFFDLRLNQQLSKHRRRWWFETPSCSLWCHCNVVSNTPQN